MEDWKLEPAKDLGLPTPQRLRSAKRESGLIETIGHLLWWPIVRVYLRLYHRLDVTGRENLPIDPPFVLCANHSSHLDAMVLASVFGWRLRDKVFPIAAGDTFFEKSRSTVFAAVALNALPLWRKSAGRHALDEIRQRLIGECCVYILFPEGTRSRDGTMGPFKPGLGMMVVGTKVKVVPCHLSGAYEAMPPDASIPRPKKVRLAIGPAIEFPHLKNNREGWEHVAATVRSAVDDLAARHR